jgi:hypothetical protein
MVEIFAAVKAIFKKIHHFLSSIINFILIVPMYFIGAGLSRLLYRKEKHSLGAKQGSGTGQYPGPRLDPNSSYWKESSLDYSKDSFERLF